MGKKAVLIGINYPGTKAELKGCINDVNRMHECLIQRFGFEEEDITILIDTDRRCTQPTGKNIRRALQNLVRSAEPGDFLFVHYSGHGTRLPAETGEFDDTGFDECIVPSDMNLITGNFVLIFEFLKNVINLCFVDFSFVFVDSIAGVFVYGCFDWLMNLFRFILLLRTVKIWGEFIYLIIF